jgi:hypothetical protein
VPNISKGLTIEGQPVSAGDLSDAEFGSMLAEQAARERPSGEPSKPTAGQTYRETVREVTASGGAIRQALAAPDPVSNSIESGLTVAGDSGELDRYGHTAEDRRRIHADYERLQADPDFQASLARGRQLNEQREAGRDALAELSMQEFRARASVAETDAELLAALVTVKREAPERLEQALHETASALTGVTPDALEWDENAADELADAIDQIEAAVNSADGAERTFRAEELASGLAQEAASQAVADRKAYLNKWAAENGLSGAEARTRIQAAENFARNELGIELPTIIKQQDFEHVFRSAMATLEETDRAERMRSFQQQLLDSPSTSVSDGLETLGAFGWQRHNDHDLELHYGPPVPDPDRTVRRAVSERLSAQEIREAVASTDSSNWQHGLTTADGNPVSVDVASGAKERFEREQREARALAMSALGR